MVLESTLHRKLDLAWVVLNKIDVFDFIPSQYLRNIQIRWLVWDYELRMTKFSTLIGCRIVMGHFQSGRLIFMEREGWPNQQTNFSKSFMVRKFTLHIADSQKIKPNVEEIRKIFLQNK